MHDAYLVTETYADHEGRRPMSGLRLYVHDRHGRHINGHETVQIARADHRCDSYACPDRKIFPGDWYGVATLYPSDQDFNYLDRDTLKPSPAPYG